MGEKEELKERFTSAQAKKRGLTNLPKSLQEIILFMEYKIRQDNKSFNFKSICGGDRSSFIVEPNFQRAYSQLSCREKVAYYENTIMYSLAACEQRSTLDRNSGSSERYAYDEAIESSRAELRIKMHKGMRSWEETAIEIEGFKVSSKMGDGINIDLRNYLLRDSKKKKKCFVLEATKVEELKTIRFVFVTFQDEEEYLPMIRQRVEKGHELSIMRQILQAKNQRKFPDQIVPPKDLALKRMSSSSFDDDKPPMVPERISRPKDETLVRQRKPSRDNLNISVIEEMVKPKDDQYLDVELSKLIEEQNEEVRYSANRQPVRGDRSSYFDENSIIGNQNRNVFKILLPDYSLSQLPLLRSYRQIHEEAECSLKIYQNEEDIKNYKVELVMKLRPVLACQAIFNKHLYKYWHPQIQQSQIKLKISSENSLLTYHEAKPYSKWYRNRDYLILMHLFKDGGAYYLVGKSVENTNYIPHGSITRGQILHEVWKFQPWSSKEQTHIVMETKTDHGGLLKKSYQHELTCRYLKGFAKASSYFQSPNNRDKLSKNQMNMEWGNSEEPEPYKLKHHLKSLHSRDFEQDNSEISDVDQMRSQSFYSIDCSQEDPFLSSNSIERQLGRTKKTSYEELVKDDAESEHQLEEIQVKQQIINESMMKKPMRQSRIKDQSILSLRESQVRGQPERIACNSEGIVILPHSYLKKKFVMAPYNQEVKKVVLPFNNLVQKGDFEIDKSGGLKLINQAKVDAQNNVFKYVLKTLKKNLFSGKGIMNISLPVDIFNKDSNLQRMTMGMSMGPEILEKAVSKDGLERFKLTLGFGMSVSILCNDAEKSFNPILGETYQGYVRGCPYYAEQISHHPPITSILIYGRGYRISANLEGKITIHMNSGEGVNQGFINVNFDDGQTISFQTPGGEVTGMTIGDRKFNLKGSGHYIDRNNRLFCEMKFSDDGGFFSKKKRQTSDEITGEIVKVTEGFIRKFVEAPCDKKPSPDKTEIVQTISSVSGRWPVHLMIDGEVYYDPITMLPDVVQDEVYPLPSNSNYREDLYHRKMGDLVKSQHHKERLEVLQREDRKLREKFHGKH